MRLFIGLLTYLVAAVAIVGGAAAVLLSAAQPAITNVVMQQETRTVAPRIQMWLDRKAEALVYEEKAKAAALAEEEQAKALRLLVRSRPDRAYARAHDEDVQAVARDEAARRREARQQSRQLREAAEQAGAPRAVQGRASHYYPDLHARID